MALRDWLNSGIAAQDSGIADQDSGIANDDVMQPIDFYVVSPKNSMNSENSGKITSKTTRQD